MTSAARLLLGLALLWTITCGSANAQLAQETLINYYYQSVLARAPEAEAVTFWTGEFSRLVGLGQEPEEVLIAMSNEFFGSSEYASRNRSEAEIVSDLYRTFLQREADSEELEFWTAAIEKGFPLNVLLAGFQFSPEFAQLISTQLGTIGARAEGRLILDFYRGYLNRLPESGGFEYWLAQLQAGQCTTFDAFAAQVAAIAQQFEDSSEYAGRNHNNLQFVGDLYSTFMRRSAEIDGLAFWTVQLNAGESRTYALQAFLNSDEFQQRLAVAFAEGCFQPGALEANMWRSNRAGTAPR